MFCVRASGECGPRVWKRDGPRMRRALRWRHPCVGSPRPNTRYAALSAPTQPGSTSRATRAGPRGWPRLRAPRGDKLPGGVEGKEEVAAVGFKLDASGREDEEGFCEWVRGAWDGDVSGRRGGGTGHTVEDLSEAGPEKVCQCDHRNDADGERDISLSYLGLRKKAYQPLHHARPGDTHPRHEHHAHQHNHVPRPPHRPTQDASAAITRKAPMLDAVLGEALPVGDGELGVHGQGRGVHALCRSGVRTRERKDGLISQHARTYGST